MNELREFLNSPDGQKFIRWWKKHRHAGYALRGIDTSYCVTPDLAWNCDKYRAEFYCDNHMEGKLMRQYDASEYESWAKQQDEFENRVETVVHKKGYL